MRNISFVFLIVALSVVMDPFCARVSAALRTETVEYQDGDVTLEGYLAYKDSLKGKAPGVLIVHEWTGIGPYVKKRAQEIAALGYVAFAVDIYGKGVRPKDRTEAAAQAGIYRKNRALMRERARAGLLEIRKLKFVDPDRIAAIGYCFGGGVVLELARSGADIRGVASFHGNLDTPHPENSKNIRSRILVLHGADDPYVPADQIKAFEDEMRQAKIDWQMVMYGNALHSFTNPDSGNDPSGGVAYSKDADKRSWETLLTFLKEIFQ